MEITATAAQAASPLIIQKETIQKLSTTQSAPEPAGETITTPIISNVG